MAWEYSEDDTVSKKTLFSLTAESMESTLEMVKKGEKAPGGVAEGYVEGVLGTHTEPQE